MERLYSTILSEDYTIVFGSNIVDQIRVVLKAEVVVSDLCFLFLPPDISPKCFDDVLHFVLLIYARMRGEDVSMKLLRKNNSLKLPNR